MDTPINVDDLETSGIFAAPQVELHWTDEVWPGDQTVTKSPNQ